MKKINLRELLRLGRWQEVRPLHIILGNRNFDKFGEINNVFNVNYHSSIQTSEFTFTIYKTINGKECRLWDEIINRRLIWVKEYDEWFEIYVDVDDSEQTTKKNITATALYQAELSNINIEAEINTEVDIEREDYVSATFYNEENEKASILHRILKKVPNYTIGHVDKSLWGLWRAFSISEGTNIYDFLTDTLQEEIGCLFLFDSQARTISVYDMQYACECGYRSENEMFECPKCDSHNITAPFGNDTTIMVSKQNLGQSIQLTSNAKEVKNCFTVTGGDEYINAAIRSINPDGTNVIYEFDEYTKKDMPSELTNKITDYDLLIREYKETKTFNIDHQQIVRKVNDIISNVNSMYPNHKFDYLSSTYTGYSSVISSNYDIIDLYTYLNTSMMPTWEQSDITAKTQCEKIESELDVVSVKDVSIITEDIADNAVLLMVRAIIDTSIYKPEIINSSLTSQTWQGQVRLTNYSDEEDTSTTVVITVEINDDVKSYLEQAIKKISAKSDVDGVEELFEIEDNYTFSLKLKEYCMSSLKSFESAYNSVLLSLSEVKASETTSEFYKSFYEPYYEKLGLIQEEISERDTQLGVVLLAQGIFNDIKSDTNNALNFEDYLGKELWNTFISYRREDIYSNENYISDGLSNAELVEKAEELIEVAHKELIKSSEKQYSISATLVNLLLIKDEEGNCVFEPILDDFTLGNFIRCKIDGIVYKMRIMDININYDDLSTISITFGDVVKNKTILEQMSDIVKQSNSIAASYSSVKKQANKGETAKQNIDKLRDEGLNSSQYNVFSTNSTITFDEHGLLAQNYDDITDQFSQEKLRLNGSDIIMTDDNWKSTKLAIGKQQFTIDGKNEETYGVNADTVIGGKMIAGDIYSANYKTSNGKVVEGTHFDLENGNFDLADGRFSYDKNTNILKLKGVTLDWNTSNAPEVNVDDVNGLNHELDNINKSLATVEQDFAEAVTDINGSLSDLQSQIDGNITTWFYDGIPTLSNAPANEWNTDEDKNKHLGDLYYNNLTGYAYRFQLNSSVYSWLRITDSDVTKALADAKNAQDTADGKRRVFVVTPTPPYDIGDLWVQGDDGDIMRCQTSKTSGSYSANDWIKASKYTDDTTWKAWTSDEGDFGKYKSEIQAQLDGKSTTTYGGSTPPSNAETGDLWFCTDESNGYKFNQSYMYDGTNWQLSNGVPDEVWDLADGKSSIFTIKPYAPISDKDNNFYHENDIWILESDMTVDDIFYKKGTILVSDSTSTNFTESDWHELVKYTDDTTANSALDVANTALDSADRAQDIATEAKNLGEILSKGLGFKTQIGDTYVISPNIVGGYLKIVGTNGTKAEINSNGELIAEGAVISGKIVANGGTIGGWNIEDKLLYTDYGNYSACIQVPTSPDSWVFMANETDGENLWGNWYVTAKGEMYAQKANIKGIVNADELTANNGTIGGWNIGTNLLYANYGNYSSVIQTPNSENSWVFMVNETLPDGSVRGNWYVTAKGEMYVNKNIIVNVTEDNEAIKFIGSVGEEVEINRDEIKLWYRTLTDEEDCSRYTMLGKGYININNKLGRGEISLNDRGITLASNVGTYGHYAGIGFPGDYYVFWISSENDGGNTDDTYQLRISQRGEINCRSCNQYSARRYKTDITLMPDNYGNDLLNLDVVTYTLIRDSEKNCEGMIAEDVYDVMQYPVSFDSHGQIDGLDYSRFVPRLIKLCQNQQKEIDELKTSVAELKDIIAKIQEKL